MANDLDRMAALYPFAARDFDVRCGICSPDDIQNRLTDLRWDTVIFTATPAVGVLTFAPQVREVFVTGKGEQYGGAPAGCLKDLSHTNADEGGSVAESPCLFTSYAQMFELLPLVYITPDCSENYLPAEYYDDAYNRAVLGALAKRIFAQIIEPNGCTADKGPLDLWPSDGSSRGRGDANRSAMLGVMRGERVTICWPGENAKRPKERLSLEVALNFTQNGANPFDPLTDLPEGSVIGVPVRVTMQGSVDGPLAAALTHG